jgi:fructokinase
VIVVAGEAVIDLVGDGDDDGATFRAVPGGSPANVAVALARLNQPVKLLARMSDDAFGRRLREHLVENHVDLSLCASALEPAALAIASLDTEGRAAYDFYLDGAADWQWRDSEMPALGASAAALHAGSLALALAPGCLVLENLLAREHRRGALTISIDLNLRPSIVSDVLSERARVERQIRNAHLVKASDEDLAWLYPGRPVDEIAAGWRAAGVACSVITLGARGAYLLAPSGVAHHQTARPIEVVDTVGAGDAFTAGMLAALAAIGALGTEPGRRLATVTPQQWLGVLDHASAVAALTCTRRGADPPTRAELEVASAKA